MADMGVGETALATEALSSTAVAEGTAGGSFAGPAFAVDSAGAYTPALSASTMGPTYAELGYSGLPANFGSDAIGSGLGGWGSGNIMSSDAAAFGPGWSSTGFNPALADAGYGPGWSPTGFNPMDPKLAIENPAAAAAANQTLKSVSSNPEFLKDPLGWMKEHPIKTAAAGVGIYTLANMLKGGALTKPNYLQPYTPPSAASYGLGKTLAPSYKPQTNAVYNRGYAGGGEINVSPGSVASGGVAPKSLTESAGIQGLMQQYGVTPQQVQQGLSTLGLRRAADGGLMQSGRPDNVDFMGGDMYPMSQQNRSYYATPTQAPTSAQAVMAGYEPKTNPLTGQPTANMAKGGIADLGSYSDGGRLLKGPGDGMSDNIPATIADKQPARLADGEFVVPADVVSHLGNGSTDAGAKHLYSMMDKVRKARTGSKKQGKQIKAGKYLPA